MTLFMFHKTSICAIDVDEREKNVTIHFRKEFLAFEHWCQSLFGN